MRSLALALLVLSPLHATLIGRNTPVTPMTVARVMTLAPARRGPWLAYLKRSAAQEQADKAALAQEREGLASIPLLPQQANSARSLPLDRDEAFYRSDQARHIGDVILSFQTPGGGWSKNLAMDGAPRQRGQLYATANLAPVSGDAQDFDKPLDEHWHYISTLDNDATNTELHFLARLSAAFPGPAGDVYRAAAQRGIGYLLHAQYPNGGWPQVWPLEGGYHDAITFNDDAVTESAETLTLAARAQRTPEDWSFIPPALRHEARAAAARALELILAAQFRVPATTGRGTILTVWPQQADPLTLAPVSARNYEMPALSSSESATLLEYLMSLDHPSPAVVRAIDAAAAWFEAHKIEGFVWSGGRGTPGGRTLKPQPGAGPLWARYYSLTTGKPIFGDRDRTIHDNVMDLSLERRNGYGCYGQGPAQALGHYADWNEARLDGCLGAQYAAPANRKDPPCNVEDR